MYLSIAPTLIFTVRQCCDDSETHHWHSQEAKVHSIAAKYYTIKLKRMDAKQGGFHALCDLAVLKHYRTSVHSSSLSFRRLNPHLVSLLRRRVGNALERHVRVGSHVVRRLHHHITATAPATTTGSGRGRGRSACTRRRSRYGVDTVVRGYRVLPGGKRCSRRRAPSGSRRRWKPVHLLVCLLR